ncbi:MAG: fused MFS/spermidine synthase [Anaerolineae bacterium]|nr:fused MFS/spermidine synthase [Anaerolineae bacterium]
MTLRRPLVLFFLTGVSALIYEICWVRQGTLTFGVSVYAYSAVLTAYMGGMALGGYLIGRRVDRSAHPLRLFAALQVILAALGLAVPFALESGLTGLYAWIARSLPPAPFLLNALRLLLSLLVLTPPAICIGAALPVMSRVYAREDGRVGGEVGRVYVVHTLGAVIGCLLTAIFLIRLLGTRATILLASAINLAVAGMAGKLRLSAPQGKRPAPAPTTGTPSRAEQRFVLWAYAISGFAALGYEVVWARVIALYTLGAVYSFSIMLSVFLAGLVVGGWLGTWWLRRERRSPAVHCGHFGLLELGVGTLAILALLVFGRLHSLRLEHFSPRYSVAAEMAFEGLLSFITLFPVTTLVGAIFPVVSSLYTAERAAEVGMKMGRLTALNTAGSVLGSLLTGFLIIPLLGLQRSTLALAALNIGIGCVALLRFAPYTTYVKALATAVPAVVLVAALVRPPARYLGYWQELEDRLLFYQEGVETTVAVFAAGPQNPKFSTVNGRVEVPTDILSLRAFYLLGHLPPLLKPNAQSALMLSFGNGIATGALSTHGIPQIEVVELSPEMIAAAQVYARENRDILSYPGLRVHVEDARNFLLQTDRRYDIITTDATHPSNACSWALFTVEFYRQVARHLAPDGVFIQWVPLHSIASADYRAILRTFQSVFPHATLWYTGGSHTLLLATPQPLTGEYLAQRLTPPHLDAVADLGTEDIARYWVMDSEQLRQFAGNGAIVRDDRAFFLPINADTAQLIQVIQLAAMRKR